MISTRHKVFVISLLIVSVLIMGYSKKSYSAEKLKINENPPVRIKITLISGKNFVLENAKGGPWELKSATFSVTLLFSDFQNAEKIGENLFRFFLSTGKTVEGTLSTDAELSGQSDWGTSKIKWNKIKAIEVVQDSSSKATPMLDSSKFPIILKLIDGKETRFSEILGGKWTFNLEGFECKLEPPAIKKIQRLKDGILKIILKEGLSLKGRPLKDATFEGRGEWGKVTIPWVNISLADFSGTSLEEEKVPRKTEGYNPATVKLKLGLTLKALNVNIREVTIDELVIYPDENKIRSCKSINGKWEITPNAPDMPSVRVTFPKEGHIDLLTTFATGKIYAKDLESIEFLNPLVPKKENLNWRLTTKFGTQLNVFLPEKENIHAEIIEIGKLRAINFSAVKEIHSQGKDKPYEIIFASGKKYQVESFIISGPCSIGEFRISGYEDDFKNILHIRGDKAKSQESAIANIELKNGDSLNVFSFSMETVPERKWGKFYCALDNGTYQYWVHKNLLEKRPWQFKENRLIFKDNFKPREIECKTIPTLTVTCNYGELKIYSKAVSSFTPSIPEPPVEKSKAEIETATIRLTTTGKEGSSKSFHGKDVFFVRYPATVWCPTWYYQSAFNAAFHFYRFNFIPCETPLGLIEVSFNKIAKIKIADNYIELENLKGNKVKGKIKKEEEDESYTPAKWKLEKDGVLLELTDFDGYLFVPLSKTKEIIFSKI